MRLSCHEQLKNMIVPLICVCACIFFHYFSQQRSYVVYMYYMVVIECKILSVCNIPYYYVYFDDDDDDMFTLIMMMI